jgi:predicted HicB family RNase H-like nuclease
MGSKKTDIKTFNMRMPKDIWMFLKKTAAEQEESMTDIIVRCVKKYKKKFDDKLTIDDTSV